MRIGFWIWIVFNAAIVGLLLLDLLLFRKEAKEVSLKQATIWSAGWIALAFLFALLLLVWQGRELTLQYLAGYLIEKSLSADNLFVFLLLFDYFKVPDKEQRRVLFWGVLGALVLRGAFILAGTALIRKFEWVLYVFGAFLVYTGIRIARRRRDEKIDPEKNPFVRLLRRIVPVTDDFRGSKFIVRERGRLQVTPLMVVLVAVEATYINFAIDSIPAILAVSREPFIVYSANVFALLGLRSLYFVLTGAKARFRYLKPALAAILIAAGVKMLLAQVVEIPIWLSLAVIVGILAAALGASVWVDKRERRRKARQ
jgi:tellurite resistance protein TerC